MFSNIKQNIYKIKYIIAPIVYIKEVSIMCLNLLWNPNKTIDEAYHNKDYGRTFLVLFFVALIYSGSLTILTHLLRGFFPAKLTTPLWQIYLIAFFGAIVIIYLKYIIFSFLSNISMKTLAGKGTYYNALTSLVYSNFAPSIGVLIFTALFWLSNFITTKGMIYSKTINNLLSAIALLILIITLLLGFSTYYKSMKELYETNYMAVFIHCLVICFVITAVITGYMLLTKTLISAAALKTILG